MDQFWLWLRGFVPGQVMVNGTERMRACCGALLGILLTGLASHWVLGPTAALPLLIAPMGASAVLLFGVPASPLAQPWSIIGGNLVAAVIGVACARWIPDPLFATSIAVSAAIGAMFALRCLHPPSGAVALTAVLGGPAVTGLGFHFVLAPVLLNSLLLLLVALLFNNATRRRYPHVAHVDPGKLHQTKDQPSGRRIGFTQEDLDHVLQQYNQVLDVSRDDLENLILQTELHAYRRRFGAITCADIMSRDVVSVEYGTSLEDAWALLLKHRIKALPVINSARRLVGIVTQTDFMRQANLQVYTGFEQKLKQFIQRTTTTHSDKPEVVGQIMTSAVQSAVTDAHIVELVQPLSDSGIHHIPIVDDQRRLVGMVTQSDMVAALYRGNANLTTP
ncbi:HPP family protein [Collimonas sp. OK412]|jgi:CBS domain-containing membrane protein|uniref:HPP family protein n=1 Tax=Collimonas sp. (strain OK412) TaxID=1801619 RepID=UPI0008DF9EF1|nr:HPP family protein [Collimonas sp. OK412]SFD30820.1 CBS domain-containing membrane protein [Collimonas sp. OK412]